MKISMASLAGWLWHLAVQLGLVVLILVALYAGLSRQALRFFTEHPQQLVRLLQQQTGFSVQLRQLHARWRGVQPVLWLDDVVWTVADARHTRILLPEIEIEPEVWDSLRWRQWRFAVRLRGLQLHWQQDQQGKWSLLELAGLPADPVQRLRVLHWVLQQPALELEEGRLYFTNRLGQQLRLNHVQARYSLWQTSGQLQCDAVLQTLSSAKGPVAAAWEDWPLKQKHLQIRLQYSGSLLPHWQAQLQAWMKLPDIEWIPWWNGPSAWHGLTFLKAGGQIWLQVHKDGQWHLQMDCPALAAQWQQGVQTHLLTATRLQAELQQTTGIQRLNLADMALVLDHKPLHTGPVALQRTPQGGSLQTAQLDLGEIYTIVASAPGIFPPWIDHWPEHPLRMTGHIPGLELQWTQSGDAIALQDLRGQVTDLSWMGWNNVPDLKGVTVQWSGSSQQGQLLIQGKKTGVRDDRNFSEPIGLQALSASVRWNYHPHQSLLLRLEDLYAKNADARLHVKANLWWPDLANHLPPQLSLLAGLDHAQVATAWRYLPRALLGTAVVSWVQQALTAGSIGRSTAIYEGRILAQELPSLALDFPLQQVTLAYAPGWPPVQKLATDLRLEHGVLSLKGATGWMADTQLESVQASLDTRPPELQVRVQGETEGPAGAVLTFLRTTPLEHYAAKAITGWVVQGQQHSQVQLDIPLDSQPVQVHADLSLPGNDWTVGGQGLVFSAVSGELHYDSDKGLAGQLHSQWLGQPLNAVIDTVTDSGNIAEIRLQAQGTMAVAEVAKQWPSALWSAATGSSAFSFKADWRPSRESDIYTWRSDLQGIAVALPYPLNKPVDAAWPTEILASNGAADTLLHARIDSRLGAAMMFHNKAWRATELRLGGTPMGWPSQDGLKITGSLPALDLDAWYAQMQRFGLGGATGGTKDSACCALNSVAVSIGQLNGLGYQIPQAKLTLLHSASVGWQMRLDSRPVQAEMLIPVPHAGVSVPWRLHLIQLYWPLPPQSEVSAATAAPLTLETLRNWPDTEVVLDALHIRGYPDIQGRGEFHNTQEGAAIKGLQVHLPGLDVVGQYLWSSSQGSALHLNLHSNDLSRVFEVLDAAPTLDAESADMPVDLHWPGGPEGLHLPQLAGQGTLQLSKGRILSVSRAASVSRVFGLINFADLGRRLKLDFSDLTEKGVAFDAFTVNASLQQAVLHLSNFSLKGPAINVTGQGTLELQPETAHVDMTVTVPVTRVLPLALVVVAGPVIGGAALAAQAVLSHPLDQLTTVHYQVEGNWSNPVIRLVGGGLKLPMHKSIVLPVGDLPLPAVPLQQGSEKK